MELLQTKARDAFHAKKTCMVTNVLNIASVKATKGIFFLHETYSYISILYQTDNVLF